MNPLVGRGRSAALRSPKGGAFRAKRRPRPTTTAGGRRGATLARRPDVARNRSARDGRAPVSAAGARRWGKRLSSVLPSPASPARGARQSLSTAASAPGNESPGCHFPLRTLAPYPLPARDAGFGVALDRSGSHAGPPSHCSAPVRFPAGRSPGATKLSPIPPATGQ